MRFIHPTTVTVSGSTSTGKTQLVLKLIEQRKKYFNVDFHEILYFYKHWNDAFSSLQGVNFIHQKIGDFPRDQKPRLCIFDDLMDDPAAIDRLVSIYTAESHHYSLTVFFLNQDLFFNKKMRSVTLNTKIFILFGSRRGFNALFAQLPEDTKWLKEVYQTATQEKYGHFVINLSGVTEYLRFASNILDQYVTYFVRKGTYQRKPLAVKFDG
jgi:hypothetical protein